MRIPNFGYVIFKKNKINHLDNVYYKMTTLFYFASFILCPIYYAAIFIRLFHLS